jgi:hypothetical protein
MSYTVAHSDAAIKRHEFDAYVRLLEERGIDWTNAPRVAAPGASNRWLYVWNDRPQAEEFCAELKKETRDDNWLVRELSPPLQTSTGSLIPVVIFRRLHSLGAEFTLDPFSRMLVKRRFPGYPPVTTITLESSALHEMEQQHSPMFEHLAVVITNRTAKQLAQLGGYRIVDPATDETIFEDAMAEVASRE